MPHTFKRSPKIFTVLFNCKKKIQVARFLFANRGTLQRRAVINQFGSLLHCSHENREPIELERRGGMILHTASCKSGRMKTSIHAASRGDRELAKHGPRSILLHIWDIAASSCCKCFKQLQMLQGASHASRCCKPSVISSRVERRQMLNHDGAKFSPQLRPILKATCLQLKRSVDGERAVAGMQVGELWNFLQYCEWSEALLGLTDQVFWTPRLC